MIFSKAREFDRSRLIIDNVDKRVNNLSIENILNLELPGEVGSEFMNVAEKIVVARRSKAENILMMGAHVIRDGVQRYLIDLMEKGMISCIALNGAGMIHDFEFAAIGGTTESVSRYITDGKFGMWKETGKINAIVSLAAIEGMGLGKAVGREILNGDYPFKELSVLGQAFRLGIPVTVHVGIGYDIVFQHPNCDGGAYGETSYRDFLRFAGILQNLENGVVMNFGSAVMAPEIFLKALSMARNVATQQNRKIAHFTTLVCDLVSLPSDYRHEAGKDDPSYYFRPWKTMLVRTVADGGESFFVRGRHKDTFPQLWYAVLKHLEVEPADDGKHPHTTSSHGR